MAKLYKNKEGNYLVIKEDGKSVMLLSNGSSYERVDLDYHYGHDGLIEIINFEDKAEILGKGGIV